jgi:hypothetical protein
MHPLRYNNVPEFSAVTIGYLDASTDRTEALDP